MPEPIGGLASGSRPHAASWQLLLEDAAIADLARPAGEPQCLLAPSLSSRWFCSKPECRRSYGLLCRLMKLTTAPCATIKHTVPCLLHSCASCFRLYLSKLAKPAHKTCRLLSQCALSRRHTLHNIPPMSLHCSAYQTLAAQYILHCANAEEASQSTPS